MVITLPDWSSAFYHAFIYNGKNKFGYVKIINSTRWCQLGSWLFRNEQTITDNNILCCFSMMTSQLFCSTGSVVSVNMTHSTNLAMTTTYKDKLLIKLNAIKNLHQQQFFFSF